MLLEVKAEVTLDEYYHNDTRLQSILESKIEYFLLQFDRIHYGKKIDLEEEAYEVNVIVDTIVNWYKDMVNKIYQHYDNLNIPNDNKVVKRDLAILYEGITQAYVSVKVTDNIDVRIVNDIPLNYLGEEE
jgi:hypothetical protein